MIAGAVDLSVGKGQMSVKTEKGTLAPHPPLFQQQHSSDSAKTSAANYSKTNCFKDALALVRVIETEQTR